jgi:uncharacterized membrane protein YdbT with pleckstrin-like domain
VIVVTLRPVPFPTKLLNDDEEVILDLHPHWWYFAKPLSALVVAVAAGVWALGYDGTGDNVIQVVTAVAVVLALGWFLLTYARWATTNFVITSDRLIYRHGVLAKKGIEIPLERVNTVFFSQSIFERVLGSGDLVIESAGEKGSEAFSNVRKPSSVQNEIYKQMEANENRKFDRMGARAGGGSGASIPEQIQQLDDLRRRGVLSDAEFASKKADLLRRM